MAVTVIHKLTAARRWRLDGADAVYCQQHGDDTDPFVEAEEQELLREREAKRRNLAMIQQMAASQVPIL